MLFYLYDEIAVDVLVKEADIRVNLAGNLEFRARLVVCARQQLFWDHLDDSRARVLELRLDEALSLSLSVRRATEGKGM